MFGFYGVKTLEIDMDSREIEEGQLDVDAVGIEQLAVSSRTKGVRLSDDRFRVAARHPIPVAGIDRPVGLFDVLHLVCIVIHLVVKDFFLYCILTSMRYLKKTFMPFSQLRKRSPRVKNTASELRHT